MLLNFYHRSVKECGIPFPVAVIKCPDSNLRDKGLFWVTDEGANPSW